MENSTTTYNDLDYCWICYDWHTKDTPGSQHPKGFVVRIDKSSNNIKEKKDNSRNQKGE